MDMTITIMPWIWLGLTVLMIIIEGLTSGLTTIWFAFGAFLMIFAALLKLPIPVQIVLFVLISFLLLIFTRPILKKKLAVKKQALNTDALIGQKAIVTKDISELEKGVIKINGIEWTAASEDKKSIPAGSTCVIKEIKGATAVVSSNE